MIVHAGLVARRAGGLWRGALIEGPSGAGKSDLALRLLALGWRLVADDRVLLWSSGGRLYGRAPDPLHGLLEVRGLGVLSEPASPFAEVALLATAVSEPERCPDPSARVLADVTLPVVALNLLEPSAAPKLDRAFNRAVAALGGDAGSQLGVSSR